MNAALGDDGLGSSRASSPSALAPHVAASIGGAVGVALGTGLVLGSHPTDWGVRVAAACCLWAVGLLGGRGIMPFIKDQVIAACVIAGLAFALVGLATFRAVLIPALILLCGVWPAMVMWPHAARSKRRWMSICIDLLASLVLGIDLYLVFDQSLLGTPVPAIVIVPFGVWSGVLMLQRMTGCRRIWLQAGANVMTSLTLGTLTLLLLTSIANMTGLTVEHVTFSREVIRKFSEATDIPGWLWAAAYAGLALAGAALAVRAKRQRIAMRRSSFLRIVPRIMATQQLISIVHMTLLVATLIGIAAPAALGPSSKEIQSLRDQLRARYVLATEDMLKADATAAAYDMIRTTLTPASGPPSQPTTVASILFQVQTVAGPGTSRSDGAKDNEYELAHRIGALQSGTVVVTAPKPDLTAAEIEEEAGELDQPIRDSADAHRRLDRVDRRQADAIRAHERLRLSTKLAVSALASAATIPQLGDRVQLVQEYLGGLIEASPLEDSFYDWAKRRFFREPAISKPRLDLAMTTPDVEGMRDSAKMLLAAAGMTPPGPVVIPPMLRLETDASGVPHLVLVQPTPPTEDETAVLDDVVEFTYEVQVIAWQPSCQGCAGSAPADGGGQDDSRPDDGSDEGSRPVDPEPVDPVGFDI